MKTHNLDFNPASDIVALYPGVTALTDNTVVQRAFDKYEEEASPARHLIENFFCKLKQFRAIATRYDKTARNFLAAVHFAAAVIWLD